MKEADSLTCMIGTGLGSILRTSPEGSGGTGGLEQNMAEMRPTFQIQGGAKHAKLKIEPGLTFADKVGDV